MSYDCIIVGAGPSGIFAALELVRRRDGLKVLIIEKGRDIGARSRKDIFSGWGGAGTYSDGKLNLSREVGGSLSDYVDAAALDDLISYTDALYLEYGAPRELKGAVPSAALEGAASRAGLRLISFPIRHIGTDRCTALLKNLRRALDGRVEMLFEREVADVLVSGGAVAGVRTVDGAAFHAGRVLLCPGRSGAGWLKELAARTGLSTDLNPVDIGVRVEVPASTLRHATDALHEAKLMYRSRRFDDHVRTFCMNPYGAVVKEGNAGFCTVNGHSYSARRTENTNFAVLVSTTFTEPFREPIEYGQHIAKLANLLSGGVMVQRLGDLIHGRRSTPERIRKNELKPTLADATPGDLSFVLPYRYLSDILEMLEALDGFAPGVNAPSTLLYGVEVKFYSVRLKLSGALETEIKDLFAAGDGAGVTRGLIQASASGILAAREMLKRTAPDAAPGGA
jgi:uncharacterized FAD-dependent dehydrogenase